MAKILICTGIYPPRIGGPAQYAKEVADEFRRQGHSVKVLAYGLEHKLPTLIRHELFFWRTFFNLLSLRSGDDFILALDSFSVGLPAMVAAKFLRKKIIIRTGGDFLWEWYVERTGDLVLLKDFYKKSLGNMNWKERKIFQVTKWVLQNANAIAFSTDWQRKIFEPAYDLDPSKNFIVENFYGPKSPEIVKTENKKKIFVAGTRPLKWKNIERLKQVFSQAQTVNPTIELDTAGAPYERFINKIKEGYAVVLVSLGDISPNMILDSLRANTPFILTKETGLYEKLKDIGIFVDPENPEDIKEKILYLADEGNYRIAKEKVERFNFTHTWSEICNEILNIASAAKK